jgi:hypothetical protein
MDNLSANRRAANDFFPSHNMEAVYLPANASWLNAIECDFTALQAAILKNSDDRDRLARRRRIYGYLRWRNRHRGTTQTPLDRFMC